MPSSAVPSRRERLREETSAELKRRALDQIRERGQAGLSLSAVARSMGMSGPAVYRYFASRDDLLAVLVAESYDDLADALESAAQSADGDDPGTCFRAVAAAYRGWALTSPHRYRLAFSATSALDPDLTAASSHRSMLTLLSALVEAGPPPRPAARSPRTLDKQLAHWARNRAGDATWPPALLHLGVTALSRLHGLVSLEIERVFDAMRIDPALLFAEEVDALLADRAALR